MPFQSNLEQRPERFHWLSVGQRQALSSLWHICWRFGALDGEGFQKSREPYRSLSFLCGSVALHVCSWKDAPSISEIVVNENYGLRAVSARGYFHVRWVSWPLGLDQRWLPRGTLSGKEC